MKTSSSETSRVSRESALAGSGGSFETQAWPAALLFLVIAGPICFLGLGSTDAVTMEGIVVDGARHMARTQEYSVPHLYGETYSYKPPFAYWLALGSFRLFGGESEWALRFPFALCALIMGLAVLGLTRRVAGAGAALLCAFASLTGALMIQKLHLAEFDMPLTAGVGIAAVVACRGFATRPSLGLWLLGYLALSLAFLTKGAPALMFYAPGLLLAAVLSRRFKDLLRPAHLAGVLLFALVAGGWIASAYQASGWAAFAQPFEEAQDKGLTWNASLVATTLTKPLLAVAFFLPWTLLLPASFKARAWSSEPIRRMALAASAFVIAGVAVFMVVPADESRYLLPLAAPMGLLCGLAAQDVLAAGSRLRRRMIEGLTVLVCLAAVVTALDADEPIWWLAAIGLVGLGAVVREIFRGTVASPIRLLTAVAILVWLTYTGAVEPHRASSRSLREMANVFESHLSPTSELWTAPVSKHYRHSSLSYYLDRPIQTFTADKLPAAGDYVIFFSDEHDELMQNLPFEHEVVERREQRKYEYTLSRVTG